MVRFGQTLKVCNFDCKFVHRHALPVCAIDTVSVCEDVSWAVVAIRMQSVSFITNAAEAQHLMP